MAETNQYDSLGEKTRQINIAMKYTGGDVEKAKQMVNGQLDDVIIIKGRFSAGGHTYGVFLVFFNIEHNYIMNINSLLTDTKSIHDKVSINDGWKFFYSKFKDYVGSELKPGSGSGGSYEFTRHLADSLGGYDIFEYIVDNNIEIVTDILVEIIEKYYQRDETQCQLNFEKTSSLQLELLGIPAETVPISREKPVDEDTSSESEEEKLIAKIEKEAEHIVDGRVIVSPVKGKYINDILPGDRMKVLLTNENDDIAVKVATAQKALTSDGEMLPVKARVKAKIPLREGGFAIYGVVAKNILAKIVEEENVKIEMETVQTAEVKAGKDSQSLLYLALLIGALLIGLLVIIMLV